MQKLSKTSLIKNVTLYSTYLILVWAFYRFLFKLPDEIEELIVKPVVWLLPLVFLLKKEKQGLESLGITLKNLFPAIYLSLGLGAIFVIEGIFSNYVKYGTLNFAANLGSAPFLTSLGLSFATAFSEEISFRGYIFNRLWQALGNEITANVITTLLWIGIHIPVAFVIWKLSFSAGVLYLILTGIYGAGSAFVFGKTKNVFGSIFLHVLWEWPIILFR